MLGIVTWEELEMDMKRRSFLTGGALLTVSGIVPVASGMLASEQAAHDKYKATQVPPPDKLLDSEPLLQVPAPDSVGVSFAVNALSVGYAQVADNPEMKNAREYVCDGMPRTEARDEILVPHRSCRRDLSHRLLDEAVAD